MTPIRKGTLLTIAALALLAIGVGTAVAAGGPPRPGTGYAAMPGPAMMATAASYLGISPTELQTERHAGKSLAQIATEHGKSVDGLETALVNAFGATLDRAVAAGRLTSAQAAQALAAFKARVSAMVQWAGGPAGGRGGMMGGFGCPWAP